MAAITKALRQDPQSLRLVLLARKQDIESALAGTEDPDDQQKLADALDQVTAALDGLVVGGAEEGDEAGPDDEIVEVAEEGDAGETDAVGDDGDEVGDTGEADGNDGAEPPENPVAMSTRLRKEMGDLTADYLDDYAGAIHQRVIAFFEMLNKKALDLGTEEDDGETSLRELLKEEVGQRGLRRLEPVFDEWRAALVKKLSKDVNEMFAPREVAPEVVAAEPTPDRVDLVGARVTALGQAVSFTAGFAPAGRSRSAKLE